MIFLSRMPKKRPVIDDVVLELARRRHEEELARLRAEMDRVLAEQREQNVRFTTAINNISQGLCFFDGHQRLIVCNELYARMYNLSVELVRPGTTLREIVDHRFAAGCFPEMSREEYLRWREAIAISPTASDTEVELRDGRIIAIHHQPMPDGGWVATHADITEARRAQESLQAAKEQLEQLALHDPLTGLANRRKFLERFEYEAARGERSGRPLGLLLVDIDYFKAVNDRHGHLIGDACLKAVAMFLNESIRKTDLAARFGGEEFVILLPDTPLDIALSVAERIRAHVEAQQVPIAAGAPTLRMTISIGATSKISASFDSLLASADAALYLAKSNGRNRVCA